MAKIDFSLDDIIRQRRKEKLLKKKKIKKEKIKKEMKKKPVVFHWKTKTRSGTVVSGSRRRKSRGNKNTGKLIISNLDVGVLEVNLHVLFGELGNLKSLALNHDLEGRSLGTAEVVYSRRSDAVKGNY